MDGYSVNEAAAVLGIPEGRVWELLARGVLSGSSEVGGDMRVFLREVAVVPAPAPEGNGNDGNGGNGELTPFRELLTEFRNLTERYGQALLALGEARGEVASLRGRVDLLEARIEHRLPWTEAAPDAWAGASDARPEELAPVSDDVVADILGATLGPAQEPEPEVEPEPAAEPAPAVEMEPPEEMEPAVELAPMDVIEPAAELEPPEEIEPAAEVEPMDEIEPAAELEPPEEIEPAAELEPAIELAPLEEIEPAAALEPIDETEPAVELEREELEPIDELAEDLERQKPPPMARIGPREALSGFAEALARAQDPATASVAADFEDLPGAQETADAVAAYRRETEIDADAPAIEPEEEPNTEAEFAPPETESSQAVVVSIVRPGYSTDTPEPDWIAEEDLIISAGEDASVRADELARQAATSPSGAWPKVEEEDLPEPQTVEPEAVVEPETAEVEAVSSPDPWPEIREEFPELVPDEQHSWEPEPVEPAAQEAESGAAESTAIESAAVEPKAVETEASALFVEEPEPIAPTLVADESIVESEDTAPPIIDATAPETAPESATAPEPKPEIPSAPESPAPRESRLTPVDIAVEPAASDDVALLVGMEPFAEPPIVPPEPAFWEAGAGTRAPFAIAQPDPWEASPVEPMPVVVAAIGTPSAPDEPDVPLDEAAAAPVIPKPASIAPEPPPVAPEPTRAAPDSPPAPPRLSPAAEAGRAAAARRRRPRGPAARALRRLRYLLD